MSINYREIQSIPGIYKILNKINNKIYIGSSNNCKQRAYSHISSLKKGIHKNQALQNSWNKYGEENFEFIIIACVFDTQNLTKVEQEYLDEYQPYDSKIGYNICSNAQNTIGVKQSPETIEKKRLASLGEKNPFYGKKHSDETRKIISEKAKKRMSNPKNNPYYGKKHSDEIKNKIRESKKITPFKCEQTGEIFFSTGDASRSLKLHIRDVSNCIYGRQKTTHGYSFKFI